MIVSVACGRAPPTHLSPARRVSSDRQKSPQEGNRNAIKRHSSLKRQRTEAPWNFTKNPLGVTKALTIPWEFMNNNNNKT